MPNGPIVRPTTPSDDAFDIPEQQSTPASLQEGTPSTPIAVPVANELPPVTEEPAAPEVTLPPVMPPAESSAASSDTYLQQETLVATYPTNFPNGKPAVNEKGEPVATQSRLAAALLCWFLGVFGVHRFYVGKIGTGFLMLITFGGFGIWALIDFIMILIGSFRNKEGRPLYNW